MTLRVASYDEIQHVLECVGYVQISAGRARGENYEYERGAYNTLRALALAFDLPWDDVLAQIREGTDEP